MLNESDSTQRLFLILSNYGTISFKKLLTDFVSLNILFFSLSSKDIVPTYLEVTLRIYHSVRTVNNLRVY